MSEYDQVLHEDETTVRMRFYAFKKQKNQYHTLKTSQFWKDKHR